MGAVTQGISLRGVGDGGFAQGGRDGGSRIWRPPIPGGAFDNDVNFAFPAASEWAFYGVLARDGTLPGGKSNLFGFLLGLYMVMG